MKKALDKAKIKKKLKEIRAIISKKLVYFVKCFNRFGIEGVAWWLKTHAEQDEFENALADLRNELSQEKVNLLLIEQTFLEFTIPEEDLGHVYWYTDAHNKLAKFESHLDKKQIVDVKLLKEAMNELKFIGQSNEFHEIYQLRDIQNRINAMYKELQSKIIEQQSLEKQKLQLESEKNEVAMAQAEADKAAAIAKTKMMEGVKIKEKRLAIIEEKKRQIAKKETAEIQMRERNELAEIGAKKAETERQAALQNSYKELELKEKIKELPLEELIEAVNQQIEQKKILTFIQLDQISKLKATIEEKKQFNFY